MKPTNTYYDNYAKQSIIETTLQLMREKDFSKITITEITKNAQVARRTFYLYYNDKYDIFEDYYRVLTREYDHKIQDIEKRDHVRLFFDFWYEHSDYLKLLYKQKLFHLLLSRFNEYLINRAAFENNDSCNKYSFSFSSGGLWAMLYTWTEDDFNQSPDSLAQIIEQLY